MKRVLWQDLTPSQRTDEVLTRLQNGEWAVAKHAEFTCRECKRRIPIGKPHYRWMEPGLVSVKLCEKCATKHGL